MGSMTTRGKRSVSAVYRDEPAAEAARDDETAAGAARLPVRVCLVLVLVAMWGAALATMLLLPMAMYAAEDCAYGNGGLLCTRRGQHLGVGLPWLLVVGATAFAAGAVAAGGRRRRAAFWAWSVGLLMLWAVMLAFADGDPTDW